MGLKSIEMQVALPRTQDVGRIQEQYNQRTVINLHLDGEEQKIKAEQDRQRSEKINSTENNRVQSEEKHSQHGRHQKKREKQEKKQVNHHVQQHPFKGKHIDYSL